MEKVLLVINASQPQYSSVDFACRLAALTKSRLTGLLVENPYTKDDSGILSPERAVLNTTSEPPRMALNAVTDKAVSLFLTDCENHGLTATVLVNKGEPIQEVLRESRYADLLIVDPAINFYGNGEQLPSHFTKEILANAECPVLLAPAKRTEIEEVVFCYDGSASAMFAFKQFTYLLPGYKETKTLLLEAVGSGDQDSEEDRQRVMEWLQLHYSQVECKTLSGSAKDELFTYFFMKEKKMVVMGSYGRSALSNFFRQSAADSLIRTVDLPVFITHMNR